MRSLIEPLALSVLTMVACAAAPQGGESVDAEAAAARARQRMVADQLEARGIQDTRVLEAMREVPRHRFVPANLASHAYADSPLLIGHDQTISQPFIVALMSAMARPGPSDRALEIGTGSGYQTAVLAKLVARVYTIELVEPLAREARARLAAYPNVETRIGDGYAGWPEQAPFDVILVTAAAPEVPQPLVDQLKPGGRLVIPVGDHASTQDLRVIEKRTDGSVTSRSLGAVRFVPLVKPPA